MALGDSQRAIGGVTRLLQDHLMRRGFNVSIGKPEAAGATDTMAKLNLFLYEAEPDGHLRNVQLDPERPPPLWLVLKYLLTAFDNGELSDSAAAHELLGRGMAVLHGLNFLALDAAVDAAVRLALENSPEPLKLSFEAAPADAMSRLMQGNEERYRLSVALQVRPVMLLPDEPPRFSQLVGIDYTQAPPAVVGRAGVRLAALPSLGPRLSRVEPETFEPGQRIHLHGEDLHLGSLGCTLGGTELRVLAQRTDRLVAEVESPLPGAPLAAGRALAAGEHALAVRQALPGGRSRSSNLLLGRLCPVVTAATLDGAGTLAIDGLLLGRDSDDVLVVLLRDGAVAHLFDTPATGPDQTGLTVPGAAAAVPAGLYTVLVRVNGQQARLGPQVAVA